MKGEVGSFGQELYLVLPPVILGRQLLFQLWDMGGASVDSRFSFFKAELYIVVSIGIKNFFLIAHQQERKLYSLFLFIF